MNPGNALYQFTENLVNASNAALANTILHLDIYEEFKGAERKWIRFSGMRGGEPVLKGDGVQIINGIYQVFFVVQPVSQKTADRIEARELSQAMASEWVKAVYEDQRLGGRVCGIGNLKQIDDWFKPGTVRMPVTVIQIKINPE